jgi:hypothetical protein
VVLFEKPEGKVPLGSPGGRWEVKTKLDFQEVEWGTWTGLMWLRTGKVSGLFLMQQYMFGFHKM